LVYSIGVFVASRGEGAHPRRALKEVFRLPLLYAALGAGLARYLGIVPTGSLMETIALTGNAAIPVMLIMLGIQLINADLGGSL
ncbi:MAG: AEC family transporter, partial [Halobacteriaceae archaeon]